MELFQRMPLLSRPGSRWRYSSPGYVLLGWIVQEASGEPYASFLAEHIFAPLGLGSTSAGDAPGGPGMARGYRSGQPMRSFDLGTASPGAGDVWSTADDLVRWDDALAAGELLTPGLRREMLTAHAPIPPGQVADPIWIASGYGYGWFVGTAAGRRSYFHRVTTLAASRSTLGCRIMTSGVPCWTFRWGSAGRLGQEDGDRRGSEVNNMLSSAARRSRCGHRRFPGLMRGRR